MSIRRSGERLAISAAILAAGLVAISAHAQDPPKAPAEPPAQEPAKADDKPVGDLAARYRLRQMYTDKADKGPRGAVNQFQVAFRETVSQEGAKATPRVLQAIFSERPVRISLTDDRDVIDSVRHYTEVKSSPDPWKDRKDGPPLKDLTIWYRAVGSDVPLVMVLTPNRLLREDEYGFAINYDFVTKLAHLIPETPLRIGDTWRVSRNGMNALVREDVREGSLTGKLVEIRNHPKVKDAHIAVLSVSGKLVTVLNQNLRDTAVNTRIEFAYVPDRQDGGVIDATGAIEKLRLVQVSEVRLPPAEKPVTIKRDLNLEMRRPGEDPPLAVPTPAPSPTPENSWLTFTDPEKRYHLRHPQEFRPDFGANHPNIVDLLNFHVGTRADIVRLEFVEKPEGRPESTFKLLVEDWQKRGYDVQRGVAEQLPEADWPGMSVYHMEVALRMSDAAPGQSDRRFFDGYVLQFPNNAAIYVSATTYQDQPEAFRSQLKALLKTAKLGLPPGQ